MLKIEQNMISKID